MQIWQRNLIVCWFGMFITGVGFSQIAPVLPLFIKQLGIHDTGLIEQFSGVAFGVTFVISAVFSPIWGRVADKIGRKPMLLRASLGMAIVVFCTGFVQNVYELIGLRLLLGVITGYSMACTTLIATQTDREHAGVALGTLSTSGVAGSLLGPLMGGYVGENLGFQSIFFITGGLMFVAFVTTALFVKESFVRPDSKTMNTRETWNSIPEKNLTLSLFVTFFIVNFALFSVEPIITVYIGQLSVNAAHVALVAGMVFSISGLSNIISAPILGRLSDKIGPHKILFFGNVAAFLFLLFQGFVSTTWQLMGLRFLLGMAAGGVIPSVNALMKRITPSAITGRVFGLNISGMYLGAFLGPVAGGQIAAGFGIKAVFIATGGMLLANAVWVYLKVYQKVKSTRAIGIDFPS